MSEPLHFTGERFMPGLAGEIGYEHCWWAPKQGPVFEGDGYLPY